MSMQTVENVIKENVLSGRKFVTKFVDIGSGSGKLGYGVLQAEKSDKFIQAMSEATVFLERTKMIVSSNHKRELDTMSFDLDLYAGRVSGTPQTLSNYQNPNFANRTFSAEELRALTGIHKTALKENVEQKGFMNTLATEFGNANGRALERILIYGNTASEDNTVTSGYKVVNGIIKTLQADSNAVNDGEVDLTDSSSNVLEEVRAVIDAFPDKYKTPGNLVMFVPAKLNRLLRRFLTDNHDKYGDIYFVNENGEIVLEDIPLVVVPAFSTPKNGYTKKPIILTVKENIQWLADPDNIEVESDFNLKANQWDIASTIYADINYAFSDATALAFLKEA